MLFTQDGATRSGEFAGKRVSFTSSNWYDERLFTPKIRGVEEKSTLNYNIWFLMLWTFFALVQSLTDKVLISKAFVIQLKGVLVGKLCGLFVEYFAIPED